jgi:hypothetical protein
MTRSRLRMTRREECGGYGGGKKRAEEDYFVDKRDRGLYSLGGIQEYSLTALGEYAVTNKRGDFSCRLAV